MPSVKVNEAPSEQLIAAAAQEVTVTDARGRLLVLRKPPVLAQYQLVKVLGEDAANAVYMSMVAPLIYLAAIDGEPQPFPRSALEIDALIQRLDEDGIATVMQAVMERWGAMDAEADKAAVKK